MTENKDSTKKCLNYFVEIKTKDPTTSDQDRVVKRKINLAIWKVLDEQLPFQIRCSVYSKPDVQSEGKDRVNRDCADERRVCRL